MCEAQDSDLTSILWSLLTLVDTETLVRTHPAHCSIACGIAVVAVSLLHSYYFIILLLFYYILLFNISSYTVLRSSQFRCYGGMYYNIIIIS